MRLGAKWAIALVCVLGVGAAATYRWPVRSANVESAVNQAISSNLGLRLRRPASATFALLPWPTLRVVGVELADAQEHSVLSAPTATFQLSIANLVRGKVVPRAAMLQSPTALIDLDAIPAAAETDAHAPDDEEEPPALWSRVRLHAGVLHVVSASQGFDTLIESVEGSLDWPAGDRPLQLSVTGAWRDQSVAIEGTIDNPRNGLEGRSTGLRLDIAARPLSLKLDGVWSGGGGGGFTGDVAAQIHSLDALQRLLGATSALSVAGDALSIKGKMQTTSGSLQLSDSHFELAGQTLDGALTVARQDERYAISGSLAADSLRLDALLPVSPAPMTVDGQWSPLPFGFRPPRNVDLDLRLSIAHAIWLGHRIDDAAASLMCRDGRLALKLLEATAYQGAMRGELNLAEGAGGLEAQISGSLSDADFGAAFADFGWSAYRGRGGLEFNLRSTGFTPSNAISSLTGAVSLDLQAGVVSGVSIEEAIRRSRRRPIDIPRDMTTGQTTFSRAHAQFDIAGGQATIRTARVEGPGAVVSVEGAFDLAARHLNARLVATQADGQGSPSVDAAKLTIVLSGPWSAPAVSTAPGG